MGKDLILKAFLKGTPDFFYWIKEKSSTIKLVGGLKNKLVKTVKYFTGFEK